MVNVLVEYTICILKNPTFITVISGGAAGALVTLFYNTKRAKQEYKSLIQGFSTEFVLLYERCVMYYKQFHEGNVSYSSLFTFLTSDGCLKIISACDNPDIVQAIIELKAAYFQISRHVNDASSYAVESSRTKDEVEAQSFMEKARHAQGTAMAFFVGSSYVRILENTNIILKEAEKVVGDPIVNKLIDRFKRSQVSKEQIKTDK